ncbi:MAG: TIGR01777 family oxidoreductase [Pirellulales bacterium]
MFTDLVPADRIVIAGGTGYLGINLARHLADYNCEVVLISRNRPAEDGPWIHAAWDARTLGDWTVHLDGATALVNLAGRTVDCVKTPDRCDEILRSRVESTELLGQAVRQAKAPPPVWVQMSTAHIYGDPPEAVCDEDAAFGYGLAPSVGRAWEEAFARAVLPQIRPVVLRTSFVLGRNGGALPTLAALVRWGLGGTVGRGRQGISWIHEQDMNRLFLRAITDDAMQGAYLATAPQPVSNADFMRELRQAHRIPIGLPAFTWMVRIGAPLVMRTDPELALYGRYCVSRRLKEEGFEFTFPDVQSALNDLCRAKAQQKVG